MHGNIFFKFSGHMECQQKTSPLEVSIALQLIILFDDRIAPDANHLDHFQGTNICFSDIDECAAENGGCDQLCVNTDGSHDCKCNAGYTLAANKKTCNGKTTCPYISSAWQKNVQ